MATAKPRIAILMAVYEPRLDWLEQQLRSLNGQDYPNLVLYIRDDCSPTVSFGSVRACVEKCITAFPFTITRNAHNMGSNGTFELLTAEAEGDYFAYCDQDDIWLPEKLSVLEQSMETNGALLACSDMFVIDAEGNKTAESITAVRRHHVFRSGEGLAEELLVHNFVTGCTMLVRAGEAKSAIPFCPYMVHDHYLALWCAARGSILSLPQPLIRYRIHGGNQTGLMAGVTDKASYGKLRIELLRKRLQWLREDFPASGALQKSLDEALCWARAREQNWKSRRERTTVWKYRRFSPKAALFELVAAPLGEGFFARILHLAKNNIL